jgi:hypothetical protein
MIDATTNTVTSSIPLDTGNGGSAAVDPSTGSATPSIRTAAYYGPVAHYRPGDPENAWYGNFWDDTLAPVPAP